MTICFTLRGTAAHFLSLTPPLFLPRPEASLQAPHQYPPRGPTSARVISGFIPLMQGTSWLLSPVDLMIFSLLPEAFRVERKHFLLSYPWTCTGFPHCRVPRLPDHPPTAPTSPASAGLCTFPPLGDLSPSQPTPVCICLGLWVREPVTAHLRLRRTEAGPGCLLGADKGLRVLWITSHHMLGLGLVALEEALFCREVQLTV